MTKEELLIRAVNRANAWADRYELMCQINRASLEIVNLQKELDELESKQKEKREALDKIEKIIDERVEITTTEEDFKTAIELSKEFTSNNINLQDLFGFERNSFIEVKKELERREIKNTDYAGSNYTKATISNLEGRI